VVLPSYSVISVPSVLRFSWAIGKTFDTENTEDAEK
jgi:hypothetical protein